MPASKADTAEALPLLRVTTTYQKFSITKMILPIYTYGAPVLREPSKDITKDYPELETLIDNMFETMYNSQGVGLAAPQIGLPIRLVVITLDCLSEDYPEYKDFNATYINPRIVEYDNSETASMDEGCLSLPGISEPVRRPTRIKVHYFDRNWEEHEEWVESYLARVMQHEFDHLEGKVFTDRISPLRKQIIRKKMSNLLSGNFSCSYKVKRK